MLIPGSAPEQQQPGETSSASRLWPFAPRGLIAEPSAASDLQGNAGSCSSSENPDPVSAAPIGMSICFDDVIKKWTRLNRCQHSSGPKNVKGQLESTRKGQERGFGKKLKTISCWDGQRDMAGRGQEAGWGGGRAKSVMFCELVVAWCFLYPLRIPDAVLCLGFE